MASAEAGRAMPHPMDRPPCSCPSRPAIAKLAPRAAAASGTSDFQKACCVSAKNQSLLLVGQSETINKTHGLLVTHIEAIVTAQNQMFHADVPYKVVQSGPRMGDGIVAKPTQICTRLLCESLCLGAC